MALNTASATDLLELLLNGTAITGVADNAASGAATTAVLSLHTADPGAGGSQTTSEAAYTGYARVSIARTTGGWTVTSGVGTNVADIEFPICTAGDSVAHGYVGLQIGAIFIRGTLTSPINIFAGITPIIEAGDLTVTA